MDSRILLATDLDRTLLPNGRQPESPMARPLFRQLAARAEVCLTFVTGRHLASVESAILEYALPTPDFVIADVGTSLYVRQLEVWEPQLDWQQAIASDWHADTSTVLAARLVDIPELHLQEAHRQGTCKLSYYAPALTDPTQLLSQIRTRLQQSGAQLRLEWSIDEHNNMGLLDILPANSGKLHALNFLRKKLAIPLHQTVFAGDSGNDLAVLGSAIPAVLVANAQPSVAAQALAMAPPHSLYLARGGLFGMNGNYSAGILEGLVHFIPACHSWLTSPKPCLDGPSG